MYAWIACTRFDNYDVIFSANCRRVDSQSDSVIIIHPFILCYLRGGKVNLRYLQKLNFTGNTQIFTLIIQTKFDFLKEK